MYGRKSGAVSSPSPAPSLTISFSLIPNSFAAHAIDPPLIWVGPYVTESGEQACGMT